MNPGSPDPPRQRTPIWLWIFGGVFLVGIGLVLAASVGRPATPVFTITEPTAREAPAGLTGPDTATLDARDGGRWTRFNLALGAIAKRGEPWDIAVKRYRLVVNGGPGLPGRAGVVALDGPFATILHAPRDGYGGSRVTPGGDTVNAILEDWYSYSLFSHLLEPRPATYAIRTHDGKYAKLSILGYYCPGPEPGCLTIEYAYQGDGSRRLAR